MSVKRARAFALKTQADVAKELGVSVRTYAKMEKSPDSFTVEQALKFSRLVGRSYNEIFFNRDYT